MKKSINNASFGMTVQKLICDYFDIVPNKWAMNQYKSNFDEQYKDVEKIFERIFNEIGAIPLKCLSFELDRENGGTINPHNFYLSNGLTLSIKTSQSRNSAKVAPQIVGQAGYDKLNYHFGHLCDSKIVDQNDIKELIWNNIDLALPIFLDYLFLSDILLWIYIENGKYEYKIIYREEKPDLLW